MGRTIPFFRIAPAKKDKESGMQTIPKCFRWIREKEVW